VTFRDDQIGVPLCGFHELKVHRTDKGFPLIEHRLPAPASLFGISTNATGQPKVSIGVDIDAKIEQLSQLRLRKDQKPINYHYRGILDSCRVRETEMIWEVLFGNFNGLAPRHALEMLR